MSEPTGGPAAPPPTGMPAPAVPDAPGQRPEPGTGQSDTDITNPDLKRLSDENAAWRNKFRALEKEHEKIKAASLTDAERAIAEAKVAGAAEYQSKWRQAVLDNAALTTLADRRVTASELALRALDLSDVEIGSDGRVDRSVIERKIDQLIERYPMLAPNAPPPGIGSVSGADQHRVQSGQLVKPGENERDALNRMARYALGRGE